MSRVGGGGVSVPIALTKQSSRKKAPQLRYRPSLPWEKYETVSAPTEFPTISDFIFKALDRRFLEYYDILLSKITYLEVDEFDAQVLVRDTDPSLIEQIFNAYQTYSPYCRSNLLSALLAWRSAQQSKKTEWSDFFSEKTNPKVQKDFVWGLEEKKVMLVNYLWAKITFSIFQDQNGGKTAPNGGDGGEGLGEGDGEPVDPGVAMKCLDFCFSSLSGQQFKLKCFESNYNVFLNLTAEILGVLSRLLPSVSIEKAVSELEKHDFTKTTVDLLTVFQGLKGMRLNIYDPKTAPGIQKLFCKFAQFTDTKQKKIPETVRAAGLDCLSSLMATIGSSTADSLLSHNPLLPEQSTVEPLSAPLPAWTSSVEEASSRLSYMIKKSKLLTLCYPLQASMLCCCSDKVFADSHGPFLDSLLKHIKPNEKLRITALDTIYRLLLCSFSNGSIGEEVLDQMCRKVAKEIIWTPAKGKPHPPQDDAIDLLVDIITLMAVKKLEFTTNEIVLQLLKVPDREIKVADLNTERVMVGFLSIKSMFKRLGISASVDLATGEKSKQQMNTKEGKGTLPRKSRQKFLVELKKKAETEEGTRSPDALLFGCGGMMDYLFPLLDHHYKSLLQVPSLFSSSPSSTLSFSAGLSPSSSGTLAGMAEGEGDGSLPVSSSSSSSSPSSSSKVNQDHSSVLPAKVPQLDLLATTISCLSFCLPLKMDNSTLMGIICRYTLHRHDATRKQAVEVLHDLMTHRPFLRPAIVNQLAFFVHSLPDPQITHIKRSLDFLNNLLGRWWELAGGEVIEGFRRVECECPLDVTGLEGFLLVFLGRAERELRGVAYETLHILAKLLRVLPPFVASTPPQTVISLMTRHAPKIVETGNKGLTAFRFSGELFEDLKTLEIPKPITTRNNASVGGEAGGSGAGGNPGLFREVFCVDELEPKNKESFIAFENALLGRDMYPGLDKWSIYLGEFIRVLASECPDSGAALHKHVVIRLGDAFDALVEAERDKNIDPTMSYLLWRNYLISAVATCGCSRLLSQGDSLATSLFKQILPLAKSDISTHAVALEFCLHFAPLKVYDDLLANLKPYFAELAKSKKMGSKKDALRVHIASVVRTCGERLGEGGGGGGGLVGGVGGVGGDVIGEFVGYLEEAGAFLMGHCEGQAHIANWTLLSLKYNFFRCIPGIIGTAFRVIPRKHEQWFSPDYRKELFNFSTKFGGVGANARPIKQMEAKQIEELTAKLKTNEEKAALKQKITDANRDIEDVTGDAIREILRGKGFFDLAALEPFSILFEYISSLFKSPEEKRQELGRQTLINFMGSNSSETTPLKIIVEKCYLSDKFVSSNYFVTLSEILRRPMMDIDYPLPTILLLVMFKLGDGMPAVRRAAVNLLVHLVSHNLRSTGGYHYHVFPDADIEPSFIYNYTDLSKEMANDCVDLTYPLFTDLMVRIPKLEISGQKRIMSLFSHWMVNVDLRSLSQDKMNSFLKSLLVITIKLPHDPAGIENAWKLLGQRETNISPILNYLFTFSVFSQNKGPIPFCKQIALYLSRASPRPTVSHLVTELRSLDVRNLGLEKGSRMGVEDSLSWELLEIFPPAPYQEPFSRSHFAMALLGNIAVEHGQECAPFLPLILHSVFLAGDRRNEIITSNALLLLHNLILSLIVGRPDYPRALSQLTSRMKILRQRPSFWVYEDITREKTTLESSQTLREFVEFVVEILYFRKGLTEEWGAEALDMAAASEDNHHIRARSLQIYRALKPQVRKADLLLLLRQLRGYVERKEPLSVGLELAGTLEAAVGWTGKESLTAMPEVFWTAVGLLHSRDTEEYLAALSLLSCVLGKIDFSAQETQEYLLGCFPYEGFSPPFAGFLPFVVKGLTNRATERAALALLSETALLAHSPVIDLDPRRRLLVTTIALLPHLCLYMGKEGTEEVAKNLGLMFDYAGGEVELAAMADVFQKYLSGGYKGVGGFVEGIAGGMAACFFPQFELLVFSLLGELLETGNPWQERVILLLFDSLLSFVKLEASHLQTRGMALFSPVEKRAVGERGGEAVGVLKKVVGVVGLSPIQIAHAKHMNVIQRLGDFGDISQNWDAVSMGGGAMTGRGAGGGEEGKEGREALLGGLRWVEEELEGECEERFFAEGSGEGERRPSLLPPVSVFVEEEDDEEGEEEDESSASSTCSPPPSPSCPSTASTGLNPPSGPLSTGSRRKKSPRNMEQEEGKKKSKRKGSNKGKRGEGGEEERESRKEGGTLGRRAMRKMQVQNARAATYPSSLPPPPPEEVGEGGGEGQE